MRRKSSIVKAGLIAALVVMGFPLGPSVANGQSAFCGERSGIIEMLNEKYDESQTAIGLSSEGHLIEVFAAPSGTWTMLVTYPVGLTCVVKSGLGWQQIDQSRDDPVS